MILSIRQVLNEYFHNVCELDLVFNFYKVSTKPCATGYRTLKMEKMGYSHFQDDAEMKKLSILETKAMKKHTESVA